MSDDNENNTTPHAPNYERHELRVFNSLSREKQPFRAIRPPFVGMYVCGPTVYSEPHLGHARTAIAFDIVFRYLGFLGYRVRYVRNITDVGHLEDELRESGEDKIAKRARLERLEPMEIVQVYTNAYHESIGKLNCLPPSIEPTASGHVPEQIEVVRKIQEAGYAYETDGSVYFDLERYAKSNDYGKLSGKVFEDLMSGTRDTSGHEDKRSPLDFALWKRAEPSHIMRWNSPWGEGFPGWHIECTTMSTKYLGERFDIHGGGLDLQFPHHEAEIAQNRGAFGTQPASYWLHSNMLTIDNRKMAKSAGNFITLNQMFSGGHPKLDQAYSPMVVRFFVLQTHYRSVIDFSNEALQAAERGYHRLMNMKREAERRLAEDRERPDSTSVSQWARSLVDQPLPAATNDSETALAELVTSFWTVMGDDFHTPQLIAQLFETGRLLRGPDVESARPGFCRAAAAAFVVFTRDVLGLEPESTERAGVDQLDSIMEILIDIRREARSNKDFRTADRIRDQLKEVGIQLEDKPDGTTDYSISG